MQDQGPYYSSKLLHRLIKIYVFVTAVRTGILHDTYGTSNVRVLL